MTIKPIIIVSGEPYSIFLEIFFKSLKKKKIQKLKNPIIIICSKNLLLREIYICLLIASELKVVPPFFSK